MSSGGGNPVSQAFSIGAADRASSARQREMSDQIAQIEAQVKQRKRQLRQEVNVFERKSEMAFGDTVSTFAKSGVDLSNSPLMVLADQKTQFQKELFDIKETGQEEIKLLKMGAQSIANARSAERSAQKMQWIGGMFGMAGSMMGGG